MLNDFSWNMTGYIPKYQVNPHGDGIIPYVAERIFQLEPEPPAVSSLNEYILSALREKNLLYFSFFLQHYEPQLNKRIHDTVLKEKWLTDYEEIRKDQNKIVGAFRFYETELIKYV